MFALTEKGELYCKEVIDELILCLPEAKRPTMASKAEIQETIKPRNAFLHLEEYCKRSDIRHVLKYDRFFGRKQHINELYDFQQPSAKKIMIIFGEGQCRNSFVYAIACAEYWTEEGVSDELKKILSWRKERYIRNMSEKTRCNIEDVTYIIDLISLVMPLACR